MTKTNPAARDKRLVPTLLQRSAAVFCWVVLGGMAPAQEPVINFATLLAVADCDGIAAWRGDIFLACHSPSNRLAVRVRDPKPLPNVMSAYVLRLNLQTGKLVYATRIGAGEFTAAFRIKVDQQGYAYAVGLTRARDFPTTSDAVQRQFGGGETDAFLVKLDPRGQIVYATLLGGSGADEGNGLELDGGDVFVGGTTSSKDFPGQRSPRSTARGDAFVSRLQPGNHSSLRSVVFGGASDEKLTGLAADNRGGLFAVGYTKSNDFPAMEAVQGGLRGISDAFLTRLRIPDLTLTFSTFFGGSGDDSGWGVAVDRAGNPVIAGITNSADLPASADSFERAAQGGLDAFVAKFEGPRYGIVRVTYFGGSLDDSSGYDGDDIKIDPAGNVWLAGLTASRDLPMRHATQPLYGGGSADGFLAAFSPELNKLCFATYRGGSDRDLLEGLDMSPDGAVLATGLTFSRDLPMPVRAVQSKLAKVIVAGRTVNAMVVSLQVRDPCGK